VNLTLIAALVSAAVSGAAGFGLAWRLQTATINSIELESANERISQQRTARQNTERLMAQYASAQSNATVRAITLRRDAVSAADVGSGLRLKTADAVRTAASDPALCSDTATALGELLTTVSTERRELAEKADRHVIDIQALIERQPK